MRRTGGAILDDDVRDALRMAGRCDGRGLTAHVDADDRRAIDLPVVQQRRSGARHVERRRLRPGGAAALPGQSIAMTSKLSARSGPTALHMCRLSG